MSLTKTSADQPNKAVVEFLYNNQNPSDEVVHEWAGKKGIAKDKVEEDVYRLATTISRFYTKGKSVKENFTEADADPDQLRMGIEVEQEHTDDKATAKRIALDHLAEFGNYYTYLKHMEELMSRLTKKSGLGRVCLHSFIKTAKKKAIATIIPAPIDLSISPVNIAIGLLRGRGLKSIAKSTAYAELNKIVKQTVLDRQPSMMKQAVSGVAYWSKLPFFTKIEQSLLKGGKKKFVGNIDAGGVQRMTEINAQSSARGSKRFNLPNLLGSKAEKMYTRDTYRKPSYSDQVGRNIFKEVSSPSMYGQVLT